MITGHFYFLKPEYAQRFANPKFMNSNEHNRPYFCAFTEDSHIFWLVPISSKVDKFERIYNDKVKRYGKCDTIDFCHILGRKKAALIQNMCPVTQEFILNEYNDPHGKPVQLCEKVRKRIIHKAKKVLVLHHKGVDLLFGDVLKIKKELSRSE